jgi:hypothetical protein
VHHPSPPLVVLPERIQTVAVGMMVVFSGR